MPVRFLPDLSALFADAVRMARARFWTLFVLGIFPAVPLVLLSPFIAQVLMARDQGAAFPEEIAPYISPWTSVVAVLGLILVFIVSFAASAGMFIALSAPRDPGPRRAMREGAQRWLAYFWVQLLMGIAVLLVLVPGVLFFTVGRNILGSMGGYHPSLSLFILLVSLLLVFPAFIVISWYAFSLVLAARGEASGVAALRVSHRLVHGATGQVFGFLFAWFLVELLLSLLLSVLFPGLPLFTGLVYYFTTTILGSAYLYALYLALRKA